MLSTKSVGIGLAGMLLVVSSGIATGQETTEKTIKKVPAPYSEPGSGAQMWKDYCASCHGATGAGDGPAADILKTPPKDLSLLARQNNGKFPAEHFVSILRFGSGGHAHGTSDMPFWGPLFRSLDSQQETHVKLRIHNLSEYVESLQQK
jgi:mono/diheme cytochrome c family protein